MESHLLQMRGLKLIKVGLDFLCLMSHLLQMRGLKPDGKKRHMAHHRRIFYRCVD